MFASPLKHSISPLQPAEQKEDPPLSVSQRYRRAVALPPTLLVSAQPGVGCPVYTPQQLNTNWHLNLSNNLD